MSTTPEIPPDWKEVLDFVQTQADRDRKVLDRSVKYAYLFFGALVACAAFLIGKTLSDAQQTVKAQVDHAIEGEVRRQLNDTERVRAIIEKVAAERVAGEARGEIARQVQAAVTKQQEFIRRTIGSNLSREVVRQTGRKITRKMRAELLRVLKASPPAGSIHIAVYGGPGTEAYAYAAQFLSVFREGGWQATLAELRGQQPLDLQQPEIHVRDPKAPPSYTAIVVKAFEAAWDGWGPELAADPNAPQDAPVLIIPGEL